MDSELGSTGDVESHVLDVRISASCVQRLAALIFERRSENGAIVVSGEDAEMLCFLVNDHFEKTRALSSAFDRAPARL